MILVPKSIDVNSVMSFNADAWRGLVAVFWDKSIFAINVFANADAPIEVTVLGIIKPDVVPLAPILTKLVQPEKACAPIVFNDELSDK